MRRILFNIFYRIPELIILLIFTYFAYYVLVDIKRDTLLLTNSVFAICATLSSISFSFSKAISEDKTLADRINFAGERFLHCALFLIIASVMKWAAQALSLSDSAASVQQLLTVIEWILRILLGVLFSQVAMFLHTALKTLNPILLSRLNRVKDWDTFF